MNEQEFRTGVSQSTDKTAADSVGNTPIKKTVVDVTGHNYAQSRMHVRKEPTADELLTLELQRLAKQELIESSSKAAKETIAKLEADYEYINKNKIPL